MRALNNGICARLLTSPKFKMRRYRCTVAEAERSPSRFPLPKLERFRHFRARHTARASQGLDPGECSWEDRGFRPGEPFQTCHTITALNVQYHDTGNDPGQFSAIVNAVDRSAVLADLRLPTMAYRFKVIAEENCLRVIILQAEALS